MTPRHCPICRKAIKDTCPDGSASRYLPFCSERCKLVDLGAWLDADYRVAPSDPEWEQMDFEEEG